MNSGLCFAAAAARFHPNPPPRSLSSRGAKAVASLPGCEKNSNGMQTLF